MKKFYDISQQGREADVYIFGDITSWPYQDNKSAGSLIREIQELDVDIINLHIDSYGGSVKEGWGMYNALREHKAKINTYADGFVASAALYPFLAGDNRFASPVAAFYLHEVSVSVGGYAEDLRAAADDAEKMTKIGVQAFVEVTGTDEEKILELMKQETWLTPDEALELGICTQLLRREDSQIHTQSVRQQIVKILTAKEAKRDLPPPANPKPEQKNIFARMFAAK